MNVKGKKVGKDKVSLSITCEFCGKPISKTSVDFGLDCEDDCGRKAYEKAVGPGAELAFLNKMLATAFDLREKLREKK